VGDRYDARFGLRRGEPVMPVPEPETGSLSRCRLFGVVLSLIVKVQCVKIDLRVEMEYRKRVDGVDATGQTEALQPR